MIRPIVLAITVTALATPLAAQDSTAAPLATAPAPADSFAVLVPFRPVEQIAQELIEAKAQQQRAQLARAEADTRQRQAEVRIQAAQVDIDRFKRAASDAKKAKNEGAKVTAEGDKAIAELRKTLYERRRDLRKAEIELAIAEQDLAAKQIVALELEQTLQARRGERGSAAAGGIAAAQFENGLAVLEGQVLEAQRKQADVAVDVARREKDLVERRIALQKAQGSLQVAK